MPYAATQAKSVLKMTVGVTLTQIEGLVSLGEPSRAQIAINEAAMISGGPTLRTLGKSTWGSIPFECWWNPIDASHVALLADIQDDTPAASAWEVGTTLVTNPGLAFSAFVSEFGLSFPNSGSVMLRGAIQQTTDITPGAAGAVTPSVSYVPVKSDGTTMTWAAAAVSGVENIEISGLTRAVVAAHAINATNPVLCAPSYSRTRGNLAFDLLYDSSDATHGALLSALGGAAGAVVITCTDTGAAGVGFSAVLTGWNHITTEANRVRVTGYLTTDITVTP